MTEDSIYAPQTWYFLIDPNLQGVQKNSNPQFLTKSIFILNLVRSHQNTVIYNLWK